MSDPFIKTLSIIAIVYFIFDVPLKLYFHYLQKKGPLG